MPFCLIPKEAQLPASLKSVQHLHSETLLEVNFPLRVVGVGRAFEGDMPMNGSVGGVNEFGCCAFASSLVAEAVEYPIPVFYGLEIAILDPVRRLFRMSSFGPFPQAFEDSVVYLGKNAFTDNVPVIVRPTSDEGIEASNQFSCAELSVLSDGFSDLFQERVNIRFGWFDKQNQSSGGIVFA